MISRHQQDQLSRYATAVRSSPHNLLSAAGLAELESRHIPECVAFAQLLPQSNQQLRLVDVGSGGGLPGLIIALLRPDLDVTLVESKRKKSSFLEEAAAVMDVLVRVRSERVEDIIKHGVDRWDLVTARAVAPMHRLAGWTLPLLRPGGLVYAVKGDRWEEELAEAESELQRHGGRVVATPVDIGTNNDRAPRVIIVTRDR